MKTQKIILILKEELHRWGITDEFYDYAAEHIQEESQSNNADLTTLEGFLGWMELRDYHINDGEGHGLHLKTLLEEFLEEVEGEAQK